jgi:hypothetical protein
MMKRNKIIFFTVRYVMIYTGNTFERSLLQMSSLVKFEKIVIWNDNFGEIFQQNRKLK